MPVAKWSTYCECDRGGSNPEHRFRIVALPDTIRLSAPPYLAWPDPTILYRGPGPGVQVYGQINT